MPSDQEKLLLWRCRRGMRELDLMLIPFFESCYALLPENIQADFARLLEESDQDLFNWLRGGELPDDPVYAELVKRIRQFAKETDR